MIRLLRIKLFINFNENPRPQYISEFIKNGKTESSSFLEKNLKDCLFVLFLETTILSARCYFVHSKVWCFCKTSSLTFNTLDNIFLKIQDEGRRIVKH